MDTVRNLWFNFLYEYCSPSNFEGEFADFIVVGIAIIIVFLTSYQCVKCFIKPGEKEENHIKRLILEDNKFLVKSDENV